MTTNDRKAAIRAYKETPRPMGVYAIRNVAEKKCLVASSVNLPAALNRDRFQLEHGSHPNRRLQADWNRLGAASFEIAETDRLQPPDDSGYEPADDLAALLALWRETLAKSFELYN